MGRILWLLTPVFFITSIVQLAAIYSYFSDYLYWNSVGAFTTALILTWFPLIGGILGFIGATHVWHWSSGATIFLFIWPTLLFFSDVKIKSVLESNSFKSLRLVTSTGNTLKKLKNFTDTDAFNKLMVVIVIIAGVACYLALSNMR